MPNSPFISYVGSTGPLGPAGGNIVHYNYNHITGLTAPQDPESGNFSFLKSGLSDVTDIWVHQSGNLGNDNSPWISGIDDSTNDPKGSLRLFERGSPENFALFNITGSITSYPLTGYYSIPTSFVYSSDAPTHDATGVFLDSDAVVISFARAGDIGPLGPQGILGPQGPQGESYGPQGPQGILGPQGPSGATGTQGTQGVIGPLGPQGILGSQGPSGATGTQGGQGTQGTQGDLGPQGPSGNTGIQGSQGSLGPQGILGPQGAPAGPQGPVGEISGGGFLAYHDGPQSLLSNTENLVNFAQTLFNFNTDYSTSTNRFSPSISGTYLIQASVRFDNLSYNREQTLTIKKDGTTTLARDFFPEQTYLGNDRVLNASIIYDTNTGSYFEVYANPGTAGYDLEAGFDATRFSAHILGGPIGPQGPSGVTGSQGTVGPQGILGPQGPQGISGSQFVGSQGAQGPQGEDGPIGPTGLTGPSGEEFVGSQGPQGPQGEIGQITGAGFHAFVSGQGNVTVTGQQWHTLKSYDLKFDINNDWTGTLPEDGYWKPGLSGKYLLQAATKFITYRGQDEYAYIAIAKDDITEILCQHSSLISHPTGELESGQYQTYYEEPSIDISRILEIPATGEKYFVGLYAQNAGDHLISGDDKWTHFSAHMVGGIQGPQGILGPQGSQGTLGPQGPQGETGPGALTYNIATSDSQAAINNAYIINNSTANNRLTVTLPSTLSQVGRIEVIGNTFGGWKIAQNTGQKIFFGNISTEEGTSGYLESSHPNDCVRITALETGIGNFAVTSSVGSIIVY